MRAATRSPRRCQPRSASRWRANSLAAVEKAADIDPHTLDHRTRWFDGRPMSPHTQCGGRSRLLADSWSCDGNGRRHHRHAPLRWTERLQTRRRRSRPSSYGSMLTVPGYDSSLGRTVLDCRAAPSRAIASTPPLPPMSRPAGGEGKSCSSPSGPTPTASPRESPQDAVETVLVARRRRTGLARSRDCRSAWNVCCPEGRGTALRKHSGDRQRSLTIGNRSGGLRSPKSSPAPLVTAAFRPTSGGRAVASIS